MERIDVKDTDNKHVKWITLDVNQPTVYTECLILNDTGNQIYYIPVGNLDEIDRGRISRILAGHSATSTDLPLFEVLGATTLPNGMNALRYFHQLVKVVTYDGTRLNPAAGKVAGRRTTVDVSKPAPELESDPFADVATDELPRTKNGKVDKRSAEYRNRAKK